MEQSTNELEKRIFHLKTLNDVSREIVFLENAKEIVPNLLLMIMGTYGSMQGVAFLLNDERTAIDVFSERGLDESVEHSLAQLIECECDKLDIEVDHGILLNDESVKEGGNELLNFFAAKGFALFSPLKLKKKVIGGFVLGSRLLGDSYTVDDFDLLRTLINQGAVSIENTRLLQQQLAQERVLKELEIATDIQLSFLPSQVATVQGLDLAAVFLPAKEVGGDFYDFIELPENKVGIVIADVVDKGIPAALYMALSRALIRACSAHEPANMTKAVLRTNTLLLDCTDADSFVTLFYSIYDPLTSKLRYIRAGHTYPILYKKRTNDFLNLEGGGVALGMFCDISLEEKEVDLEEGDIGVFYTDGVTEAINNEKEEFGIERLTRLIAESKDQSAKIIAETIKSSVVEFEGEGEQFDDLTLVVFKKTIA